MESLTECGSGGMAASLAPPRWADLPADLLIDISGRLRDAADLVRFHAVCIPWRNALPSRAATRRMFLPWLLGVREQDGLLLHLPLDLGRTSPTSTDSLVLPDVSYSSTRSDAMNWVVREDGTAVWGFAAQPRPTLTDLVTLAITRLPRFSAVDADDDEMKKQMAFSRGIVYRDGTVFVYNNSDPRIFRAAILRPGDTAWTTAKRSLTSLEEGCHLSAAYRGGEILVCAGARFWFILKPDFQGKCVAAAGELDMRSDPIDGIKRYSYAFESRGELMWATVHAEQKWGSAGLTCAVSVTVHAFVGADGGGQRRWTARDGRSLSDRVLFLGSPTSFAMDDDAPMGVGGCAFFLLRGCLLKYSFIDGETKLMDGLSPKWGSVKPHVWLQPFPPAIGSVREIRKRAKVSTKKKARKNNKQFSGSRVPRKL